MIEPKSTYGWRAKLGLIVPTTNTVNEAEWNMAAPDGVSIHGARMVLHTDVTTKAGKAASLKICAWRSTASRPLVWMPSPMAVPPVP